MGRAFVSSLRARRGELVAPALLALLVLPAPRARSEPPRGFPSLAQQLDRDRIAPGTALEALVRANQDLSLLRADEAKDRLPYPPWLRVWWRRWHPGAVAAPGDPTKGYPRVLEEVHEWMRAHQDLRPGPGRASARGAAGIAAAGTVPGVGENERISGNAAGPRSESDVRIDFRDPRRVIAASNDVAGSGRQALYVSTDGGATWGATSLPLAPGDAFHSDPAVDWSSDGAAWTATLGISPGGAQARVRAYRSDDGGTTWTLDGTVSGSQADADKEQIWVDHGASSPWRDRVYTIWHDGRHVFFNRRTPGRSGSWRAEPLQLSGSELRGTGIGADVKANGAGRVFALWPDTGSRRIWFASSTDGGESFSAPAAIAATRGAYDIGVPAMALRRALLYVSAGAWSAGGRDEVYAAWADLDGGTGCRGPEDESGANAASGCTSRVVLVRSTDGGASWSGPVPVNADASRSDQFNPSLAVDETDGSLGVSYYATGSGAQRTSADLVFQASTDGGRTWSCAVRVSSVSTDEASPDADSNQYGDYNGLSGAASLFLPTWTDRRGGLREEIWTAPLVSAPGPGAPALGNVAAAGANRIDVGWAPGAPAGASYSVYRAAGGCAAGTFERIASGLAASPFADTTVSGGTTYGYRVAAADANGCEATPMSACAETVATGACTLAPLFAGVASAAPAGSCALAVRWPAATTACAGAVVYDVHRSAWPAFVPGGDTIVARGVAGTGWVDAGVSAGTRYWYAVRARDAASGAGDANGAVASALATGPLAAAAAWDETFEDPAGGFDHDGWTASILSGGVGWTWSTKGAESGTHAWFSASQAFASSRALVSPVFVPGPPFTLSFWHAYAFEGSAASCYDGGTLEVTTDETAGWSAVPADAFRSGGYDGAIATGTGNPLGGRPAWCGGSFGALRPVTVDLSAWAGYPIRVRWTEGDDGSDFETGWLVDSVSLAGASFYDRCPAAGGTTAPCLPGRPCHPVNGATPGQPSRP